MDLIWFSFHQIRLLSMHELTVEFKRVPSFLIYAYEYIYLYKYIYIYIHMCVCVYMIYAYE